MKHVLFTSLTVSMLIAGCLGGDSTGPSPESHDAWIVGESRNGIITILHTVDGSEWSAQAESLSVPGAELSSVSTVSSLTAWAAGGFSDGYGIVLRTTDRGESWERLGDATQLPNGTLCIRALSEDVAWVGGSGNSVCHTTDGGSTWTDVSDPSYNGNFWQGIYPLSESDIWVCGGTTNDGLILHTTDGGASWTPHADSLLQGYTMISIAAWDQDNIWAVGHGYTVVRTTDGGDTWEIVTPDSMHASGDDANGISLQSADDAWVVLDYGNIWRTTDGGDSWTFQTVPTEVDGYFYLRISALDSNTAWTTGRSPYGVPDGVILHTTDGGATWTRQDDGNVPALWDVSFENELPNN